MNEILISNVNITSFQTLLCFILIISCLLVNYASSPVESVLFLVLSFVISGILLIMMLSEFFGITLIIIYVGAIAVLFLFVIMMLNIKEIEAVESNLTSKIISAKMFLKHSVANATILNKMLLSLSFLYLIGIAFMSKSDDLFAGYSFMHVYFLIDTLSHTENIGQILYNYYIECFLLAGLLLLVALVGSIILTIQFNVKKKTQVISRQLSRQVKNLSPFLKYYKK